MVHHPLILGPKVALLVLLTVVLVVLRSYLTADQFLIAVIAAIAVFTGLSVALWVFALRVLKSPDSKLHKRLILSRRPVTEESGAASTDDPTSLIGCHGVTVSPLRPSGIASFEGRRIRVVTDGQFLPAGSPVKVVSAKRSRIVVQGTDDSADQQP
jgi:membrane-bound serine protease (ClpP class)